MFAREHLLKQGSLHLSQGILGDFKLCTSHVKFEDIPLKLTDALNSAAFLFPGLLLALDSLLNPIELLLLSLVETLDVSVIPIHLSVNDFELGVLHIEVVFSPDDEFVELSLDILQALAEVILKSIEIAKTVEVNALRKSSWRKERITALTPCL